MVILQTICLILSLCCVFLAYRGRIAPLPTLIYLVFLGFFFNLSSNSQEPMSSNQSTQEHVEAIDIPQTKEPSESKTKPTDVPPNPAPKIQKPPPQKTFSLNPYNKKIVDFLESKMKMRYLKIGKPTMKIVIKQTGNPIQMPNNPDLFRYGGGHIIIDINEYRCQDFNTIRLDYNSAYNRKEGYESIINKRLKAKVADNYLLIAKALEECLLK